jgi:hypothetical protein
MAFLPQGLQNDFTPIQRLPTEILCTIFDQATVTLVGNPVAEAFSCSHVCRRWRETALGYPRLWGNLSVSRAAGSSELIRTCLERSMPMPLTVSVKISEMDAVMPKRKKKIIENFKHLALHYERITSMDIEAHPNSSHLLEYLDFPTPQMRELICEAAWG